MLRYEKIEAGPPIAPRRAQGEIGNNRDRHKDFVRALNCDTIVSSWFARSHVGMFVCVVRAVCPCNALRFSFSVLHLGIKRCTTRAAQFLVAFVFL